MRKLGILSLIVCCCSCGWLESPDDRAQQLLTEELKQIDWNELDQYPLFLDCDETLSKAEQRACFEQTLIRHFTAVLADFQFELSQPLVDTIYVDFLVDREGQISILEMNRNSAVDNEIPEFDGIITRSLKQLPELQPALKRGMPVKAKFRIPIVLNTRE